MNKKFDIVFKCTCCLYMQLIKTLCQEKNRDILDLGFSQVMIMGPDREMSCLLSSTLYSTDFDTCIKICGF